MEPTTPIDESAGSGLPKRPFKPSCGPKCRCRLCQAARKRAKEALDGPAGEPSAPIEASVLEIAPPEPVLEPETAQVTEIAVVAPEIEAEKLAPIEGNPVFVASRRTGRDRIAEWVLMRSQGMRNHEIAAKMGIQANTLNTLISKATKEGWLRFDSPADRLEHELAPLVVDNIRGFLDARDKQVTLEAAKGLGLFKSHSAVKLEGETAPTVIALRIDIAEPTAIREGGTIVGTGRLPVIDASPVKKD